MCVCRHRACSERPLTRRATDRRPLPQRSVEGEVKTRAEARHPNRSRPLSPANLWVVVPAYNEGSRLGATLDELLPRYPNVVVVDDGSRDDTHAVALARGVWVLRHPINRGQGAALQTGIRFAVQRG